MVIESLSLSTLPFPKFSVSRSRSNYRPIRCSAQSLPIGYCSLFIPHSPFFFCCFLKWFFFCSVENAEKFLEASKKGNVIPLYRCIFSDHLTPVLAYRCLVKEDERDAPSFLFESAEPGLQISSTVSYFILFLFFFLSFFMVKQCP